MFKKIFNLSAISLLIIFALCACKEVPYKQKDQTKEEAVAERPNIIISDEEKEYINALIELEDVKKALETEEGKEFTQEEFDKLTDKKLPYEITFKTAYVYQNKVVVGFDRGEEETYLQYEVADKTILKAIGLKDKNDKATDYFENKNNETFTKSYRQKF